MNTIIDEQSQKHAFGFGVHVTIALSCPSVMESSPSWDAVFAPSCSPTEYEGGGAANIMPLMLMDVVVVYSCMTR
jgi:hypothetical protein